MDAPAFARHEPHSLGVPIADGSLHNLAGFSGVQNCEIARADIGQCGGRFVHDQVRLRRHSRLREGRSHANGTARFDPVKSVTFAMLGLISGNISFASPCTQQGNIRRNPNSVFKLAVPIMFRIPIESMQRRFLLKSGDAGC